MSPSGFSKDYPGKHAVLLMSTMIMLAAVGIVDHFSMETFPYVDILWLLPIVFAAVYLSPLETVIVGLAASLVSLLALVGADEHFNLFTSAMVGVAGLLAALASRYLKQYLHQINVAGYTLAKAPMAYAEFRFPGYDLIDSNRAFDELSILSTGADKKTCLANCFAEDTAALLARYMDDAVSSRMHTECKEFHVPAIGGDDTFWWINFIPIFPSGRGVPKTVGLFAYEVTDAITRSRTREAAIRISAQAMSSLNLRDTMQVTIDGLAYIAGTNAGALMLLEDDQWVGKVGYGTYDEEMVLSLRQPYEELKVAMEAVEKKEVVTVRDVNNDDRFLNSLISKFKTRSCMVVPLVTANRVVGIVHLARTDEMRDFTEEQVKFATIIGSHAALAIENSLIYENEHFMRKSLEAIELVSEAGLVSLEIEEVLIELVTRTQDVMQMDAAMILLYDEREDCLIGRAATGDRTRSPVSQTRLRVGEGIAGKAFENGEPMKIDNLQGHKEELCQSDTCGNEDCPFAENSGIISVLAVPLRVAGKKIGVLQVGSRREAAFSAREWGLIQVLADRASMAVQNSMMHEDTIRELARVRLLRDVAAACVSTNYLQTIAERALKAVYEQLNCTIASIYFLNKERNELVNLAFIGHPEHVIEQYRVSSLDRGTLLTKAVLERRTITHEEYNLDNADENEAHFLKLMDIGYNRCARVPIFYQNEPVGAMALVFPDTRPFTTSGLETIESVANLLAVAFNNAFLPRDEQFAEALDD